MVPPRPTTHARRTRPDSTPPSFVVVLAVAALFLTAPRIAVAAEIAGVSLEESLQREGMTLVRNGAGVLRRFGIKMYVAALFVPERHRTAPPILAAGGPREVRFHVLAPIPKLSTSWVLGQGFRRNAGPNLPGLSDRLEAFQDMFPNLSRGDVFSITWSPSRGTLLSVNGEEVGSIQGRDFADTILSVLIGDAEISRELKEGLLGR